MYFGNLGMRMMMANQMPMGLWGNFGAMNFTNQMFPFGGSIFNQFPMMNFNYSPMFYQMPTWNFGLAGTGTIPAATTPTTTTLTQNSTHKTIDEIRKLNYDSPEIKTKLDKNNNISDYANYFTSNSSFKILNTVDTADGGKIYIYEDADGKHIGSVRKDKDGKVKNVAFDLADGGILSLNDSENNDGKIDNITSSSAQETQTNKNGQKFNKVLKDILAKYPDATSTSENLENGEVIVRYTSKGKTIAVVTKNSNGKIKDIIDESNTSSNRTTLFLYTDLNGNGKIDADEYKKRNDIEL